jgi:uncharacterized protein GlcG (DUF336 family)
MTYDRPLLSLEEAMRGQEAALSTATTDGTPIVVVVVDYRGDLVCTAVQDGVIEISKIIAPRKAYTAAIGRSDIVAWRTKIQESTLIPLELLLGPRAINAQGGVPIKRLDDGLILGGVGVSGARSGDRDEELARLAVDVMGHGHR